MSRGLFEPFVVAALILAGSSGLCLGEVSIDCDGGEEVRSVVVMHELLAGGENGPPWPVFRLHVPAAWVLNARGSEGANPDGWPSIGWDPIAGAPEVTWARHDGQDYEIMVSRWDVNQWTTPVALTANDVDDLDPDIAYAPDGTARLTFWSGTQVFMLTRAPGSDWGQPEAVDRGERPSVAGTQIERLAYQRSPAGGPSEIVTAEHAGQWVPVVLATTEFGGFDGDGSLDVRLEAQENMVWIVWEDSPTRLGWSELEAGGTWSTPAFEPVLDPSDEQAARLRIKLEVLGRRSRVP